MRHLHVAAGPAAGRPVLLDRRWVVLAQGAALAVAGALTKKHEEPLTPQQQVV